jgi:drug/metabolite transporter (DMT)-like permease
MLLAYTIWGWAIERRGVARTVPYLYLVPILTGLFSLFFLDERFTRFKVAGAALVLAGVGLARRRAGVRSEAPRVGEQERAGSQRLSQ